MFIDLRDRTGITQVVFNAERNAAVHQVSHALRSESVVSVPSDGPSRRVEES
jgi:aspartyl-tRNA synthetase